MPDTPNGSTPSAVEVARAAYQAGDYPAARRALEALTETTSEAAALLALCRVRMALSGNPASQPLDPSPLQADLATPLELPRLEADRLFALGWLRWLGGEPAQAEPLLADAVERFRMENTPPQLAEAAYWLARVRILQRHPQAVEEHEKVLRALGGLPQATCGFADLLWRAGRLDRAEQVWKAVRANPRVKACDEACLMEARLLLRRGEAAPARRLLEEAAPRGGVARVERCLLLAWALAALRQTEPAAEALKQAEEGPYPADALRAWRTLFELRSGQMPPESVPSVPPPELAALVRGQEARIDGRREEALAALREALAVPAAQPFARYALACLGQDDFAAVLAGQPGLFLAARCRARLVLERFARRQASPAELLEALDQAAGYRSPAADHFRRLAEALQKREPSAAEARTVADGGAEPDEPIRRNHLRAAVEMAGRRLAPAEALPLLLEWSRREEVRRDAALRRAVGLLLLRSALLIPEAAALDRAAGLLGQHPLLPLARSWLSPQQAEIPTSGDDPTAAALARLWQAAAALEGLASPEAREEWRRGVREVGANLRFQAAAQCLLVQEAARRGDAAALIELLEDTAVWQALRAGPPRFVGRAVAAVMEAQPRHPQLRQAVARWLTTWDAAALPPELQLLAAQLGVAPLRPDTAEPPPGVPAVPWRLHQAAVAMSRQDARTALAWVKRALAPDAELPAVQDVLPELERLARAQLLAEVVRFHPSLPPQPPGLLADAVALLDADPDGPAVLAAAAEGDLGDARRKLANLAARDDIPPRLAHHLALVFHRAALAFEGGDRPELTDACWYLAWRNWLRAGDKLDPVLLDWLFGIHRRRIEELLARGDGEAARRHWGYVHGLPGLARPANEALARELEERAARFREELATAYLLSTREAMRYGNIPAGWHADYEKGLALLSRLLGLDGDNVRLLTALVEVCNEWFLDCYNNEAQGRIWEGVQDHTPSAVRLARLVEGRPGDLAARAALAEFWKFRGFVENRRDRRAALYREALRFNPADENVRQLLEEMGPEGEA
ncbi:MAG TPA: hypothetical protein VFA26_08775 [Gemmataceae bacterium]|nr:hypothetical protein [Gemmataceae bacterium]